MSRITNLSDSQIKQLYDAVLTLQRAAREGWGPWSIRDSVNVLDNADVFADIQHEAEYRVSLASGETI